MNDNLCLLDAFALKSLNCLIGIASFLCQGHLGKTDRASSSRILASRRVRQFDHKGRGLRLNHVLNTVFKIQDDSDPVPVIPDADLLQETMADIHKRFPHGRRNLRDIDHQTMLPDPHRFMH
jgi:hypothetical protein